ncbi:MAG TPA: hypothetical protein VHN18_04585 [Micromonosporaceae bacterium]|nr:hypothetical protein [Micromonosporaceae bacterium]
MTESTSFVNQPWWQSQSVVVAAGADTAADAVPAAQLSPTRKAQRTTLDLRESGTRITAILPMT